MPDLFMQPAQYECVSVNCALIANRDQRDTFNVIQNRAVVIPEIAIITLDIAETDLGCQVMFAPDALLRLINQN